MVCDNKVPTRHIRMSNFQARATSKVQRRYTPTSASIATALSRLHLPLDILHRVLRQATKLSHPVLDGNPSALVVVARVEGAIACGIPVRTDHVVIAVLVDSYNASDISLRALSNISHLSLASQPGSCGLAGDKFRMQGRLPTYSNDIRGHHRV